MARTRGSTAHDTRERILAASARLFEERGYAGTSIRDIAEQVGMTKAALYYHFRSKEDVLQALLAPILDQLDDYVAATTEGRWTRAELIERTIRLMDEYANVLRSAFLDPSVKHALFLRLRLPARIAALERAMAGADDAVALLRGRCALGAIQAGLLGGDAREIQTHLEEAEATGALRPPPHRTLTEAERRLIADCALAVLGAPLPTRAPDPAVPGGTPAR